MIPIVDDFAEISAGLNRVKEEKAKELGITVNQPAVEPEPATTPAYDSSDWTNHDWLPCGG